MAGIPEVDFDSVVVGNNEDDSAAVDAIEMIGRHDAAATATADEDDDDPLELSSSTVVVVLDGFSDPNGNSASEDNRVAGLSRPRRPGPPPVVQSSTSSSSSSSHPSARSSRDEDLVVVVVTSDSRETRASSGEDMSNCETPVQNPRLAVVVVPPAPPPPPSSVVVRRRDLRPCCSAPSNATTASSVHAKDASNVHDVSRANSVVVGGELLDNISDDDVEKVPSSVAIEEDDVFKNRRLPAEDMLDDEGFKEPEDVEEDDEEEEEEEEEENAIVLEPGVLIENDEETEEVLPVDIPQPFSDEVDSLGSVDPDNDTLGSRNGEGQPPNCAEDDVAPLKSSATVDAAAAAHVVLLKSDDGEMDDFVDGPAVGVSSGCVSSRSSNSSSSGGGGDVEIEDLVVYDDEGDLSPKSFKDKSVMKRKQFVDSRNHCLGKKRCFSNSLEGAVEPEETGNDLSAPLPPALAQIHALKKRIPTKENPPPELAQWLDTFQCWSNAERLLALDQMIDLCDPTQVRHMMSVIEPQFQRDFISLLPKELALYVLSFLEPKDLLRAAQTCKYWRILAEDNLLWREKCKEAGIDERRRTKSCSVAPSPWKAAYMRQHDIEMNWRFRPIRSPKVLKGHDDHVITCLQFSGSRIVSGSDDNTLKVWSATTGKCLKTLVGHTGGVWSSQMAGSTIVSGSTDRTLKVWNADSGQCIHTLYGHTSTVRCMHLHGNRVVSGSRDSTLRLWDIGTGMCQHVLLGHCAAVRCVQYGPDGRLVVSGAYDYTVKVWNPEREECLHTLQGHSNRVYSLQFDGVHVVSGSLDTSIRVWDVESGACRHTLMGHQSLTSGMELKNNILVSGNADSTVKVWDIMTGQCLQTLSGPNKHNSAVTCLQFNSKFVITSSDDGTVKLWDLKTGEFVRNLVALDSGGSGGVVWRIRASPTKLVCAVGSRNGTEETKLLVLDFDALAELQNSRIEVK